MKGLIRTTFALKDFARARGELTDFREKISPVISSFHYYYKDNRPYQYIIHDQMTSQVRKLRAHETIPNLNARVSVFNSAQPHAPFMRCSFFISRLIFWRIWPASITQKMSKIEEKSSFLNSYSDCRYDVRSGSGGFSTFTFRLVGFARIDGDALGCQAGCALCSFNWLAPYVLCITLRVLWAIASLELYILGLWLNYTRTMLIDVFTITHIVGALAIIQTFFVIVQL